jgi:hypothetical protein
MLDQETFDTQVAKGATWIGTLASIIKQIEMYQELIGGFEVASF